MLPEYYIPNKFEVLESFPLTPIGKVDVMSLKEMEENKKQKKNVVQKILARK